MLDGDRVILAPLTGERPTHWKARHGPDVATLASGYGWSTVNLDPWARNEGKLWCAMPEHIRPATGHEFLTMMRGLQ